MKVRFNCFLNRSRQALPIVGSRKASRKIRERNGVRMLCVANMDIHGIEHQSLLQGPHRPACFNMLRTVGSGRSFFGCGTVTLPDLVGCLNTGPCSVPTTPNQSNCLRAHFSAAVSLGRVHGNSRCNRVSGGLAGGGTHLSCQKTTCPGCGPCWRMNSSRGIDTGLIRQSAPGGGR